ncbi:hypothetical protein GCM10027169_09290 [Gordonia jinhuaensis]|uniref:Uncharacterized protein n=1 Tax=Gordonia jinhuaensis TaxID=1517702 RepID=A0A916WY50_9ACTN|nr:hypothetical protein [Gordonia jinhuaensis]GGB42948.1 hypothetical protein GCM10011489_33050 [Gordonia jinhuaensis]
MDLTYSFSARGTGKRSTYTYHFSGPGPIGLGGGTIVSSGRGVLDVSVSTNAPFLAGPGMTIDVS